MEIHRKGAAMHHTPTRRGITYVEVLVVILILVAVISFLLPTFRRSRRGESWVRCSSNLKQIGLAMLLYSNENRGHYPRGLYVPGDDVKPVWGTGTTSPDPFAGPQPNDVSAALFLLLRTQDITSEVFTCPSSDTERDTYGGGTNSAINRANFTDLKKNLSYSMHNPYVSNGVIRPAEWKLADKDWWTNRMSAEFAVASDINPGTTGRDDNVLYPNDTSSSKDMKQANSNNHDGDGQNVLFGDGHVEFLQNPFVGIQRDNIFTNRKGQVVASPIDATDSLLLPTDD
jgi:prepilin-type processing-associated H-X9-DG protein